MHEMKVLKVADVKRSDNNYRPDSDFSGAEFNEMVRSIKEKGVLSPILVRPLPGKSQKYEVIAGNRRLAASKEAGFENIPAQIVDMNDAEAKEAQIVENMQRKDVHPVDEGIAFRYLIEDLNHDAADVAKRVGKSERYVRDRLSLTNLVKKAQDYFRADEITLSHALLIAKLEDDKQQMDALKEVVSYDMSVERLQNWIRDRVYTDLGNRPWAKDAKLAEMLGDDLGKTSLFGKNAVEDPVEYGRKMAAYIEYMMRKSTEKGETMVKICTSYGTPDMKGVLGRDEYKLLESRESIKSAKDPKKGIVAEGSELGRVFWITTAPEDLRESGSVYRLSPEEKAKRKKEREALEKKRAKDHEDTKKAVDRMSWPLSKKHLDVVLAIALEQASHDVVQGICKRREIEVNVEDKGGWKHRNYSAAIAKSARSMTEKEKSGLLLELILPSYSQYSDSRAKCLKQI